MPRHQTRPNARHAPLARRQGGFNLIELLMVVVIAGIGMAIAVPSFADAMSRNRIASTANEFIAAVMYARSEALQRNTTSVICASTDKATCAGAWSDGWIVWADIDRDGALGAGEVLREGQVSARDSFTTSVTNTIQFGPRGLPTVGVTPSVEAPFVLVPRVCRTGRPFRRVLTVTGTGQIRSARDAASQRCT